MVNHTLQSEEGFIQKIIKSIWNRSNLFNAILLDYNYNLVTKSSIVLKIALPSICIPQIMIDDL
jgi:hypothetical protein